MRREMPIFMVGLAACFTSTSSSMTKPAQPGATAISEPQTTSSKAAEPPYVVPKRIADALRNEHISGNVIVGGVALQPTASAARTGTGPSGTGAASGVRGRHRALHRWLAMQVVKDHGDVVELSTAPVKDCVDDFDQPYRLTVFVNREALVPRTNVDVVKTFADGTGVAIDRGAPVSISAAGVTWAHDWLRQTPAQPDTNALVYGVPANLTPATLPALARELLVCDRSRPPMTLTEWNAEQQREREAQLREDRERRAAASEHRRAELERQRPAIEREQKARAERERKKCERDERERAARAAARAKRQPKKHGPKTAREQALETALDAGLLGSVSSCAMAGMFGDSLGTDVDIFTRGSNRMLDSGLGFGQGFGSPPPFCGLRDPSGLDADARGARPQINGTPIAWPPHDAHDPSVVRQGSHYLAEVGHRCGRARVAVAAVAVGHEGSGMGGLGGGGQIPVWIPKPGPVTWLDGSPAGSYTGNRKYSKVVETDDRICVNVPDVAELVCHPKQTTATALAYRFGAD